MRLKEIIAALGPRRLVWFGTRGVDAEPIFVLGTPLAVVSQIAPISAAEWPELNQDSLETRSRIRRDLDDYNIDFDVSIEAIGLKSEFLSDCTAPIVLVAYRSAEMLAAPMFCHSDLLPATNFYLTQRQFEYKPWVEAQLNSYDPDIPIMHSEYIRDSDLEAVRRITADGGVFVGRASTGSGGAGVFSFSSEGEYVERLPKHLDGFVGVAPFLAGCVPININACVYRNGQTAVFGASYQLIGVQGFTRRAFGFCGNDFAAANQLEPRILDQIETVTRKVGKWLAGSNYLGIFGLDILLHEGRLCVSEINPRFQASTPLSSTINQALGIPDPMTEHVAAFLGMAPPDLPSVREQVAAAHANPHATPVAQVIHRNVLTTNVRLVRAPLPCETVRIVAAPNQDTYIEREALLFKSMHGGQVTKDGYSVGADVTAMKVQTKLAF